MSTRCPSPDDIANVEVSCANPFDIAEATCDIEGIEARTISVEGRNKYKVTLSVSDDISPGQKVGRLLLKLTDGEVTETHTVAVYGTVRVSK